MKIFDKLFSVGTIASFLTLKVYANRFPPACYFYRKDYITECRDEGSVATYLAINNNGIEEEEFNTFVNNTFARIKTLNYTLTSSVEHPNPYNYFPKIISKTKLEELELNCQNNISTDPKKPVLDKCPLQKNVITIKTLKRLTLRNIKLTRDNIENISLLINLEKLSFYDCDFSDISFRYLEGLRKLKDLTYSSSELMVLPETSLNKKYFKAVKNLKLEGVQFSDTNIEELKTLNTLVTFTVDNAYFSDQKTEFYLVDKTKLTEVNIGFNEKQKENVNREISVKLPDVTKKLFIKGVNATNILLNQFQKYDPNLEELHLSNVFFTETLDFLRLKDLKTIKKLTLEKNHRTKITNLRKLKTLRSLKLSEFDVTDDFLYDLGTLVRLQELTIVSCKLLEEEDVEGERTAIHFGLGELRKLKVLDIENNGIDFIDDDVYYLKNLEELIIANEKFDFNNKIGQLVNLKCLFLSKDQIAEIPEEIGKLTGLKLLDLSANGLPTISKKVVSELSKLKNLEYLDLSQNNLTRVPKIFDDMTKLQLLDLSQNIITDQLPDALNDLPDFKEIFVFNNTNIKGDVLTNPNLKDCRYCSANVNDCSSKECYPTNDDDYMSLPISTDGRCGRGHARCAAGICCSRDGWCDVLYDQCFMSNGCQPKYGTCKKSCMICELDMTANDFEYVEDIPPTTHNGHCGEGKGKCPNDYCCNKDGICTSNEDECNAKNGCQGKFGLCWDVSEPRKAEEPNED